jgi:hypothetical protein
MNCQEAIESSVSNFHTKDYSAFNTSMRGALHGTNPIHVSHHESFLEVQELLEQYTARKLSYDGDSLNAFRGVLRHYGNQEGQEVRHLWGVPYILHDAIIKHYSQHVEAYLLDGLCWRHVHSCWEEEKTLQPKRRLNFPSWSWAAPRPLVQCLLTRRRWFSMLSWYHLKLLSLLLASKTMASRIISGELPAFLPP